MFSRSTSDFHERITDVQPEMAVFSSAAARTSYLATSSHYSPVTGPEGSRKLRFPDYMTTARDGGKVVSLMHRPPLPQEMLLVLISVRG